MAHEDHPDDLFRSLTGPQRSLIDAATDIMGTRPSEARYLHSVLCQVGLPRAKTEARTFLRTTGMASIEIAAGSLYRRGKLIPAPLPHGAKPRLVLLHLCAEAVRTRSPEIQVGHSAREFLRSLGLDNGGHEYARFRSQMEALAACRMTLGMTIGERDVTINTQPISRFEAWMQRDDGRIGLWPGSMKLSAEFYTTLLEHAVPLDPRAIHGLQKSALALDVYAWLAYRLCRVRQAGGVRLSWTNLRSQFGQEYSNTKDFKREFRSALIKVLGLYPDAKVEDEVGGIRLFPSSPPIRKSRVMVLKDGQAS